MAVSDRKRNQDPEIPEIIKSFRGDYSGHEKITA